MFVDGQLVAKTSSSLRILDDWIIPVSISDVKGKTIELKWPAVSVQIATLEVLYKKPSKRNLSFSGTSEHNEQDVLEGRKLSNLAIWNGGVKMKNILK